MVNMLLEPVFELVLVFLVFQIVDDLPARQFSLILALLSLLRRLRGGLRRLNANLLLLLPATGRRLNLVLTYTGSPQILVLVLLLELRIVHSTCVVVLIVVRHSGVLHLRGRTDAVVVVLGCGAEVSVRRGLVQSRSTLLVVRAVHK